MQIFVPVFILSSDDPLLKNDRSSEIYHSYKEKHPDSEYLLFTYSDFASSGQSNLAVLENELIDGGLFTSNKVIKIYLKEEMNYTIIGLFLGLLLTIGASLLLNNYLSGFFVTNNLIKINYLTTFFMMILLMILSYSVDYLTLKFQKEKKVYEELKEE